MTPEELSIQIEASHKGGELDEGESEALMGVLKMEELTVEQVMVPVERMDFVSETLTLPALLEFIDEKRRGKLPVIGASVDEIKGVLKIRKLFGLWGRAIKTGGNPEVGFKVSSLMDPAYMVPHTTLAAALLDDLQRARVQIAIVVKDGKTLGIVTIEDLVEQVVGPIADDNDCPRHPTHPAHPTPKVAPPTPPADPNKKE